MAEVVGVVAAGVAFGEVFLKISSHIFKLKNMWQDFKEIPDNVKLLVGDIEMFSLLLQEMEADLNSPTLDGVPWSGGISHLVVVTCRGAVDALAASVDEMSQQLNSAKGMRRALRKGKLVLKPEFWAKMEKHLQRVVQLLGVAQQHWSISLTKRQPDLIISRLQLSQHIVSLGQDGDRARIHDDTHSTPGRRSLQQSSDDTTSRKRGQLIEKHLGCSYTGSIGVDCIPRSEGYRRPAAPGAGERSSGDQYYIHFKPPNWLTRKAWSIAASFGSAGFDINLRAYSVVPWGSLVMKYASVGNVEGLLELFDNKLASPFDVNPAGDGLLDVALQGDGGGALTAMIDWGLDFASCFDPERSSFTLHQMIRKVNHEDSPLNPVVFELALAHNVYESFADVWLSPVPDQEPSGSRVYASKIALTTCIEGLKMLLPRFRPGHYQLPVRDRLYFLLLESSGTDYAECLRYGLWMDGKAREEDVQALDEIGCSLLKLIAWGYNEIRYIKNGVQGWRRLGKEIMDLKPLLHSCDDPRSKLNPDKRWNPRRRTALHQMVHGRSCFFANSPEAVSFSLWRRAARRGLRFWLEDLHESGIDLNEYGRVETQIFREMQQIKPIQYKLCYCPPVVVEFVGFSYGPEPKDWDFTFHLEMDEMVGEFWELIFNPPIKMIGAWVD